MWLTNGTKTIDGLVSVLIEEETQFFMVGFYMYSLKQEKTLFVILA